MKTYAINYKGTITVSNGIPNKFKWSGGYVAGNGSNIPMNKLKAMGWKEVITPEYDKDIQELGDVYFDSPNNSFTYPVIDKKISKTLSQLKGEKISRIKDWASSELKKTDWALIRRMDTGQEVPETIQAARDAVRLQMSALESEVQALTKKVDVIKYTF